MKIEFLRLSKALMLKFLYQIKALLPQAFESLIKSQFKPMRIFPLTDINLN